MPTQITPEELKLQLKTELERSVLLEPEDKKFWLENLDTLPQISVQNVLKALQPKNQLVDSYVDAALSQDKGQQYLKDLQNQIKKIQQDAFKVEEKSEAQAEQTSEEELLGKLDQA